MLFEVPTGVVADTRGRRFSYLLGAGRCSLSTLLYLVMWQVHAPFGGWALASILLGLGFTFFSGATEAWLVDALDATGFARRSRVTSSAGPRSVGGAAMLVGSVAGGFIAQATNLGVPYIVRAAMLGVTLVVAWRFMHDIGFTPGSATQPRSAVRNVIRGSIDGGLPESSGSMADAGGAVHGRRRVLRVLCRPAVPAPALRRPQRLRHRRAWRPPSSPAPRSSAG